MNDALGLLQALIARPSVTPDDAGCQDLIAERLRRAGFETQSLPAGPDGHRVSNLWAVHRGAGDGPTLAFAGHTDVVPPGPPQRWTSDPFVPTVRDGHLYGRGAADMKSSIAAFVVAAEDVVARHPRHPGALALLLTSDEEGPARDGTVRLVEWLQQRGERLDACIVGEPTSVERLGDVIKNGRRGSLSGRLVVDGVQGHVAYPQLARNAVHLLAPALAELATTHWDDGNAHFPPTTWQVSNLRAGTGALNVVPGEAVVEFNFRFSTVSNPDELKRRVHDLLQRHAVPHRTEWTLGAEPFLTAPGTLSEAVSAAIAGETGARPQLSTTGGTSDGRFIARICPQVVELGPVNATIHQVDERVELASVDALARIYRSTIERFLGTP